ncbi:MAG TPA: Uma2 family endonuclease [Gemmatimonadaceae bacterium]|nr:Uma2 family endonuclease [Gemmatimonadaceae bacterium]
MRMPTLKRRWTADDLQDLPDDGNRYEVIDGELFVTPSPTSVHQEAAGRLYRLLANYLDTERVGHPFIAPLDVEFSNTRVVQPDVFVVPLVAGRRPERFGRLLLAVEVLSPSTARADRVAKRVLFRNEAVAEYWIVDLDSRTIERSTPADERVDVLADQLSWHPQDAASPLIIDLSHYFADVLEA